MKYGVVIAVLALSLVITPGGATGQSVPCKPLGPQTLVRIDLRDTALVTVARLVSCATERNIIFSPPSLGDKRVDVLGPKPIGRKALTQLWHAVLQAHGLSWQRRGAYEVVFLP